MAAAMTTPTAAAKSTEKARMYRGASEYRYDVLLQYKLRHLFTISETYQILGVLQIELIKA